MIKITDDKNIKILFKVNCSYHVSTIPCVEVTAAAPFAQNYSFPKSEYRLIASFRMSSVGVGVGEYG